MTRRRRHGPIDLVDLLNGPEGSRLEEGYTMTEDALDEGLEDELQVFDEAFQVEDSVPRDGTEGEPEED